MTNSGDNAYECPNCGAKYGGSGLNFCRVCGHALVAIPTEGAAALGPASQAATSQPPQPPITGQPSSAGQPSSTGQPPAYGQPPGHGQPPTPGLPPAYSAGPGHGQAPGYPGTYAPPPPRRNTVPILAGIGALALVLVLAAAGAFVVSGGFGGGGTASSSPSLETAIATPAIATPVVATATPQPAVGTHTYSDLVVGFIQTGSEAGWRTANTNSFKKTATQLGITLKYYDSQNKLANQIAAFNTFIEDPSVNVIVLAAVDVTGYDDVLRAAKAAGKLVILEDRRIDAEQSLNYTYVGSDFVAEGEKSATAMCTLLEGTSGKNVLEIQGATGTQAATDRAQGFRQKKGDCGIDIAASQIADWDPEAAQEVTSSYLSNHKDIQGIFAHNDGMAVGAIRGIEAAGLTPGKDVKVVGVDATREGFQAMIAGKLGADVECSPYIAPQVYKAALDGLNGVTTTPKWIPTEEAVFYASQGAAALQAILSTRDY
jgi:ABC-type sugar transport system substrate-binding protein